MCENVAPRSRRLNRAALLVLAAVLVAAVSIWLGAPTLVSLVGGASILSLALCLLPCLALLVGTGRGVTRGGHS